MAYCLKTVKKPLASAIAVALSCAAFAQTAPPQKIEPITVTGKSAPVLDADNADVGGFNAPLAKTPQSITVIGADLLASTGAQTLSHALKLDSSLADSYNTLGYIESLSIRGFLLDQTGNFRRNGLAMTNYAPIAFENKERIEILKGVAGLQSGVSAPGGLVNYVTKVPMREAFTISTSPAITATIAIISSVAFPKVAFKRPPIACPRYFDSSSVAVPNTPASGMIAKQEMTNMRLGETCMK